MARRVASGCLVFHDGNCLLLRRSALEDTMQGLWEMPAGKIESDLDGSPEENAIRETLEEAGIALGDVAPLGEHLTDSKRFYGFLGVSDTANVELSFEHDAYVWMSTPDILTAVAADEMMVGHHTVYFLQQLLDDAEGFIYEAESFAAESGDVRINYNANCPACISIMSLIGEEKLETDPANTYWGGGAYQKEVQHLQDGTWPCFECDGRGFFWNIIQEEPELIRERGPTCEPCEGRGEFYLHEPLLVGGIHHNLLGRAGSLLHEYNNNGNGNLLEMGENEECYDCGGTGEYDCYSDCDDGKQECYACDGTGAVEDDEGEDEVCDDCDGSGEEDCNSCDGQSWCNECGGGGDWWNEEIVSGIDNWYQTNVIDYIYAHGDSNISDALDRLVEGLESGQLKTTYGQEMYNDANHKLYNDLHDAIVYYVINTPNKPLPEGDSLDAETFAAEKITKDELVDYIDWLEDGFGFYFDNSPREVRFRELLAGELQINSSDVDFMEKDEFILLGAEGVPRGVAVESFKTVSNVYYNGKLYRKFEGRRHRERAESIAEWMMQKLSQNPRRFDYLRFGAEEIRCCQECDKTTGLTTIQAGTYCYDCLPINLGAESSEENFACTDYIIGEIKRIWYSPAQKDIKHWAEHNMAGGGLGGYSDGFDLPDGSELGEDTTKDEYFERMFDIWLERFEEGTWMYSDDDHGIMMQAWRVLYVPVGTPVNVDSLGNWENRKQDQYGVYGDKITSWLWQSEFYAGAIFGHEGIDHMEGVEGKDFDRIVLTAWIPWEAVDWASTIAYNISIFWQENELCVKDKEPVYELNFSRNEVDEASLDKAMNAEDMRQQVEHVMNTNRFESETFEARFVRSLNTPRQPMPWDLEPNMAEEGMPYLTRREYDSMRKIGYTDEEIRNGYQRSFGSESFEAESARKPARVEIKRATIDPYKLTAVFYDKDDKKIKTTHFGDERYEDYTIHKDKERLKNYNTRHGSKKSGEKWQQPMTAGALSKWILWNKPSLTGSFADYKRRFKLKGDLKSKTSGGRKRAETFATEYTPSQTLSEYDARELALSSVATGDFFTDSLKFSTTRKAAEEEDAKKLREYEKTYGKKQAKIRMRLKKKIYKEKSMGTKAGQWSARKSQKLKREYEEACERAKLNPYKGRKTEKQDDLEDWSDQKWKTSSGKKSSKTGEPYFPAKAVEALKKKGLYAKAKRQKAKATKEGKQNARYSDDIRKVVAKYRAETWE